MWSIVDQSFVSGFNFVSSVLLARFLGLQDFGVYTLLMMGLMLAQSASDALVSTPFLTLIHGHAKNKSTHDYVYVVLILQIVISVIAFLLIDFFLPIIFSWEILKYSLPFAMVVATVFLHDFTRRYFFAETDFKGALLVDVVSHGGFLISLVLLATLSKLDITLLLYLKTFWTALATSLRWWRFPFIRPSAEIIVQILRDHWRFGKWLLATAFTQWLGKNYLTIAAVGVLGPSAAGVLRVAQSIVGVLHVFLLAFENRVPASAAKAYNQDGINGLKLNLFGVYKSGGVLTFLVLLPIVIWPSLLLEIFGAEYVSYTEVLRLYALHYFIVFLGLPLRIALRTLENTRIIFVAYCVMALLSIIIGPFLVTALKLNGVVIGLIIFQIVMYICYLMVLIPKFTQIGSSTTIKNGS